MAPLRRLIRIAFLAVILSFPVALQEGEAQSPNRVVAHNRAVVRVGTLTPDVVHFMAENGEPRLVTAPAGSDLLKLVSDNCGSANARRTYLAVFLAANSENPDIQARRLISTTKALFLLPGCLFAHEKVVLVETTKDGPQWDRPVLPGASEAAPRLRGQRHDLNRLQKASPRDGLPPDLRETGTATVTRVDARRLADPHVSSVVDLLFQAVLALPKPLPGTAPSYAFLKPSHAGERLSASVLRRSEALELALRTQDILIMNPDVADFRTIKVDTSILSSDFRPGYYAVAVQRTMSPKDAAEALNSITTRRSPRGAAATLDEFEPYLAVQTSAHQSCAAPKEKEPWPFDVKEVSRVLELRKRVGAPVRAGTILVFDTGFPADRVGTHPFAEQLFERKATDDHSEPYVWTTATTPEGFDGAAQGGAHGIAVLSMALGGVDVLGSGILTNGLLEKPPKAIVMMGYAIEHGRIVLDQDAVVKALSGDTWHDQAEANVINFSLKFKVQDRRGNWESHLITNDDTMYIFAAGNDRSSLAGSNIYPPSWGFKNRGNVIVVGAMDPDGKYSSFSNWGEKYVDIVAPGCAVPAIYWDAQQDGFVTSSLEGTSMAAPLVSFAVNLLGTEGWRDIGHRKSRILGSGRYSAVLDGKDDSKIRKVRSRRALDVPTALATPFDVVRTKTGIRYGRVNWNLAGESVCGLKRPRSEVMQVDISTGAAEIAYMNSNLDDMDFDSCHLIGLELQRLKFEELDASGTNPQFRPAEPLDKDGLVSITLCHPIKCVWTRR